ncbi:FUN14 domain-containing protein 1 [Characodon lateralis]|uniref:FUN14 domain-containing protein 1 n=1 Tax=Characodon lateralis TaxID=208331 RepID=A0ABU7E9Y7_9TELE|nr:FUN14 domain-containing protein 1 [Characodon lateralis]
MKMWIFHDKMRFGREDKSCYNSETQANPRAALATPSPPISPNSNARFLPYDFSAIQFFLIFNGERSCQNCQHPGDISSISKMATGDQREAGQDDPDSEDEVYEVVDLTEYARRHQWWSRVFGNSSGPMAEKYSVATQIMMGGVTGWCAGYVFQRVGKIAATAIGGGFLLLQIANHSGYVQVDWKKVEKDVNKAKKHLKKKANKAAPEINTFIEEATDFIKRNIVLSSGFVGGFFLGLAS